MSPPLRVCSTNIDTRIPAPLASRDGRFLFGFLDNLEYSQRNPRVAVDDARVRKKHRIVDVELDERGADSSGFHFRTKPEGAVL